MQCPHPVSIINKKEPYRYYDNFKIPNFIQVPCGKCPICLDNRRQDWFVRLYEEMKNSDLSLFLTLTYDNDNLYFNSEGFPSVTKEDVQKFFKRFRKLISTCKQDIDVDNISVRYFLASEYGKEGLRPHYHACLFFRFLWRNLEEFNKIHQYIRVKLNRSWQKGFIDIGILTTGGMNYVTKYIHKKQNPPPGSDKTFQLQSLGLGSDYICCSTYDYHKENIIKHYKYQLQDVTYKLPRYYKQKIYEDEELKELYEHYIQEQVKKLKEQPCPIDDFNLWCDFVRKRQAEIEAEEFKRKKRLKMSSGIIDE